MELRVANLQDLAEIAELHAQSWRENYHQVLSTQYLNEDVYVERLALWRERLTVPKTNQQVLIAEHNGEFVGFICAFGDHHPNYGTIIDNLHIKACAKGMGLGTLLMVAVARWAAKHYQNSPLYLEVLSCNESAIGFYQSLAGKKIAQGIWHTPCGNNVEEYLYGWDSADKLICPSR